MSARVAVVGGGLAGLTAACDLADRGMQVTVLEARRRLGGAAFSFHRRGLVVDNGQHVILRCYDAYRRLLTRLGTDGGIELQDRFQVPVLGDSGLAWLRRGGGPAPLHLAGGLARYRLLPVADRLRAARAAAALRRLDPADQALDDRSFGDWLAERGQTPATVAALWNLITVAALNCDATDASLALAAMVFRTALLTRADAADIGVPRVPLEDLHARPAHDYLTARGAFVRTECAVREIQARPRGFSVRTDAGEEAADAVVMAATPDTAARLCPADSGIDGHLLARLGDAPIVNVHAVFADAVTDLSFAAATGSPVQWLFDRTRVAGLTQGQYLAISLSAAQRWLPVPAARLREIFLPELARLLPAVRHTRIEDFFVTRERRGTFRQVPGSARLRPVAKTRLPGLVLAGAWTATGWPDTMEGAVRSGHHAADLAAAHLARTAS